MLRGLGDVVTTCDKRSTIKGLYPSVTLGHGRWLRVVAALRKGTKEDRLLAERIDEQLLETEERHAALVLRRLS